jgi:hypothetical protein
VGGGRALWRLLFFVLSAFLSRASSTTAGWNGRRCARACPSISSARFARILPHYTFVLIASTRRCCGGSRPVGRFVESLAKSRRDVQSLRHLLDDAEGVRLQLLLPAVAFFMTALVRRRWMVYTTLALLIMANAAFTTPSYGGGFLPFAHVFMMGMPARTRLEGHRAMALRKQSHAPRGALGIGRRGHRCAGHPGLPHRRPAYSFITGCRPWIPTATSCIS